MTVLQRLIKSTHSAVFEKDPDAELALRVRHASGAAWGVADEVLTVRAGAGAPKAYALASYTVGQLATALQADGFEVPMVASSWSGRSALALVEGGGSDGVSNGDRLSAYTSLLWVMMAGYAGEVRAAQVQVGQALRQMIITQAEGEWLDIWGTLYGVERKQAELDAAMQVRIAREVFRRRSNARAIEIAIMDETGWDVRIEEPWREMFRLDESVLSGGAKFYDGDHVGYHLIRPEALDTVDWDVVLPIIERNKPAGVLVVDHRIKPTRTIQERVTFSSQSWRNTRSSWAETDDTWRGLNPIIRNRNSTITGGVMWLGSDVSWGADVVTFPAPDATSGPTWGEQLVTWASQLVEFPYAQPVVGWIGEGTGWNGENLVFNGV